MMIARRVLWAYSRIARFIVFEILFQLTSTHSARRMTRAFQEDYRFVIEDAPGQNRGTAKLESGDLVEVM
jgi:hypothetical protein